MTESDNWADFRDRCEVALGVRIRENCLKKLRTLNGDFRDARENVTALLQRLTHAGNGLVTLRRGPTDNARTLRNYHQARLASSALYSTLSGWRCRSNHSHLFQARVLNHSSDGIVHFELLAEKEANPISNPREPLLVQVEQACGAKTADTGALPLVIQQLQEHKTNQPLATNTQFRHKKSRRIKVHITKMSSRLKTLVYSQSRSRAQSPAEQVPRLGNNPPTAVPEESKTKDLSPDPVRLSGFEDFCAKIKDTTADTPRRSYLGSWTEPSETQAQWYTVPFTGSLRSLHDLLSWMVEGSAANNTLCELTPECKIGLAHDVAKGIMQFYKTPWLASRQLSTSICGTALEPSPTTTAWVGHLYFVCQMDPKINPRGISPSAAPETGTFALAEAENELLFNLGILLLEFGFGKPWVNLKRDFLQLEAPGHTGTISDTRIAVALAQRVSLRIGPRYMQIVKKCLRCDFGTGDTDLDREELQRCFLNDVVGGLQKLHADMVRAFSTP